MALEVGEHLLPPGSIREGRAQLVEQRRHFVVGHVRLPRRRLVRADGGAVGEGDGCVIAQVELGIVDSDERSVLGGAEGHLLAAIGRNHEPHEPSDEPADERVRDQVTAPFWDRPGAAGAHGLIQPPGLQSQDRPGLLARGRQLLLRRLDRVPVLTGTGSRQGLESLPGGIGQLDPEVRGESAHELTRTVGHVQQTVVGESCGRDRPVRQFLRAPAPLLGHLLRQSLSGPLNAGHLVAARNAEKHLERLRARVGMQSVHQRLELGPAARIVPHVGAHQPRQLAALHTHREGQQPLVGHGRTRIGPPMRRTRQMSVLHHPGTGHMRGERSGVRRLQERQVQVDEPAAGRVLQLVRQYHPPLNNARINP